jgi:hypothetical protein
LDIISVKQRTHGFAVGEETIIVTFILLKLLNEKLDFLAISYIRSDA